MWIILGFATGVLAPWMGLLLGVATIPFLGGAIDQPTGEVLRNVSIHGAAIRVLADRFVIGPAMGKVIRPGPPTWVVACAPIAAASSIRSCAAPVHQATRRICAGGSPTARAGRPSAVDTRAASTFGDTGLGRSA